MVRMSKSGIEKIREQIQNVEYKKRQQIGGVGKYERVKKNF